MSVTYDASSPVVTGGTGGSPSLTIGADATMLVVWIGIQGTAATVTATAGGVPMTQLNPVTGGGHTLRTFVLPNPPTGNRSVTFTGISGIATYCTSAAISYKNVASVGTQVTNTATSTTGTVSVAAGGGSMVGNAFMVIGHPSTYNKTERGRINQAAFVNQGFIYGDAVGEPTTTFNAGFAGSIQWLGSAVVLNPPPASFRPFFKGYGFVTP